MGYISKEDYRKIIDEIIDLLDGKTDKIIRELKKEMDNASKNMQIAQLKKESAEAAEEREETEKERQNSHDKSSSHESHDGKGYANPNASCYSDS